MNFSELRAKYPEFVYQNCSWELKDNDFVINFEFKIEPDIVFNPKVVIKNIPADRQKYISKNQEFFDNLVFNLGMVEMISYWKAVCSPKIKIVPQGLDSVREKFFLDLFLNGLGEFFFNNKINFTGDNFLKFEYQKNIVKPLKVKTNNSILVPIGGGKDSVVTLELLKKNNSVTCFSLNPNPFALAIIKESKVKEHVIALREIDPLLLEMNKKGYLNGHTPFSAYLAFLTTLVASIFGFKYIAVSNENSANEENLKYLDRKINHQYSKSFDFEKKFHNYMPKYLAVNVEYFSFLRPITELQISRIFSKLDKYFGLFLSCNRAMATNSGANKPTGQWCGKCPKCLFVYIMLYPFAGKKKLEKIFKNDLLDNKDLNDLMLELLGIRNFKPLECVGTRKEVLSALYLSIKENYDQNDKLPGLLEYFKNKVLPNYKHIDEDTKKLLSSWDNANLVPKKLAGILKKEIK